MKTSPSTTELTWSQRFHVLKSRAQATPSFYTCSGKLSLSQRIQNLGSLCLRLPYLHQQYDEIDTKTLIRRRITPLPSQFDPIKLIAKVALAALFFPAICYLLSRPTAAEQSLEHIDHLWKRLPDDQKDHFLLAFLKNKDFKKEALYAPLHLLALSYRESGLETEFILRLTQLEPALDTKIAAFQSIEIDEKLYLIAELSLKDKKTLPLIFPLLSGNHQIKILQQYKGNEKILMPLLPHAVKAALSHPTELLSSIIGITKEWKAHHLLGGSKLFRLQDLYEDAPQLVVIMNRLVPQLPIPCLFGIFWNFANSKSIYPDSMDLLESEKSLIRNTPFHVMLEFAWYDPLWTKLWVKLGQTDIQLKKTCFSLKPENREKNERFFLKHLTHADLYKLIATDPSFENLEKIFGTGEIRVYKQPSSDLKSRKCEYSGWEVTIPNILLNWWDLYEKVDPLGRFEKFKKLGVGKEYRAFFKDKHEFHLEYIARKKSRKPAPFESPTKPKISPPTIVQDKEEPGFTKLISELDSLIKEPNKAKLATFLDNLKDESIEKLIQYIEAKTIVFPTKELRKQFLRNIHPDKVEKHMKKASPLRSGVLTALMDLEKRATETM